MTVRYAQIPEWVIYHPEMPRDGLLMWLHIQRHSHLRAGCSKSVKTLASELGRSASWVKRTLSELVRIGAVRLARAAGAHSGRTHTNAYETVWDEPRKVVVDLFDTPENGSALTHLAGGEMVQDGPISTRENGSALTHKRKKELGKEKKETSPRGGDYTQEGNVENIFAKGDAPDDDIAGVGRLGDPAGRGEPKARGTDKPVARWNANDLAEHFRQRGLRRNARYPDQYSTRPLAGNFRRWREKTPGMTSEVVKAMIDAFMEDDRQWLNIGEGSKMWVRFLHWAGSNSGRFLRDDEDDLYESDAAFEEQLRRKGFAG